MVILERRKIKFSWKDFRREIKLSGQLCRGEWVSEKVPWLFRKKFGFTRDSYHESDSNDSFSGSLKKAQDYAANGGLVAPMPLLLKLFPYHDASFMANTEDIYGIDKNGKFYPAGTPIIVTLHGGIEGSGVLSCEVLEKAANVVNLQDGAPLVITPSRAIRLNNYLFPGRDVLSDLLNGEMPDGSKIEVISYSALLNEGCPVPPYHRWGVIRKLEDACAEADEFKGMEGISKARHNLYDLLDSSGRVRNSQVIAYAGGLKEAQDLIDRIARFKVIRHIQLSTNPIMRNRMEHVSYETIEQEIPDLSATNLTLRNPNTNSIDPDEPQVRFVSCGRNNHYGLIGDFDMTWITTPQIFVAVSKAELNKYQDLCSRMSLDNRLKMVS